MTTTKQDVIAGIAARLQSQDNHCTADPMFCVQEKKRDIGYAVRYSKPEETVWINLKSGSLEPLPPWTKGAEEFGYKNRWETVMVAFTEEGCKEYLRLNGHNHKGETRIYVDSFSRCPEMQAIRETLLEWAAISQISKKAQDQIACLETQHGRDLAAKERAAVRTADILLTEKRAVLAQNAAAKDRDTALKTLEGICRLGKNSRESKLARQVLAELKAPGSSWDTDHKVPVEPERTIRNPSL